MVVPALDFSFAPSQGGPIGWEKSGTTPARPAANCCNVDHQLSPLLRWTGVVFVLEYGANGGFRPSIPSLDLELAKRYLTALVKAVFPVAADKTWNLGIVVSRNAIVVEIVEQGEKPAADARAA
jgi:hypothetical protein